MIAALILVPIIAAILSLIIRHDTLRRVIFVSAAFAHSVLTAIAWSRTPEPVLNGWLMLDAPGLLFLSITSVLFLAASFYAVGYLNSEKKQEKQDFEDGSIFTNTPEAIFIACLLAFLATMTLVTASQHLGLLWVAMEATTLATAPLIYFHRHNRSLEATWKYLLICSVGIALALLGNFFLAVAAAKAGNQDTKLLLSDLIQQGGTLNIPWLRAAFLFLLVGYGTKMGLAPLHTWLPDAHSESPSIVSALLSGALLNCAFLAILRSHQVLSAAGQSEFSSSLLIVFGLISIIWAAIFILGQTDYKRMLAYSSVEHMGILALGVGVSGAAAFGAMLHAVNHSLTKAMLFFVAGNILAVYKTKASKDVTGIISITPATGVLWLAGFVAIVGLPPFGLFISEFIIAKAMFEQHRVGIAIAYLAVLALIFISMSKIFLNMAQGKAPQNISAQTGSQTILNILPPAFLGVLTLIFGLYIPPFLNTALHAAAKAIGGF
jgi:hydrogenase-4 component F